MHIGFDAKRLFQNTTGLGNYSRSLVSGLQQQFAEHRYTLFAPKRVASAATEPFLTNAFQLITPPPTAPSILRNYWRTHGIVADIKRTKIDLYHGLSHEIPLGMPKNIAKIVTVHDLIWQRYPNTYSLWDRKMHDWKCAYACRNADRIVAISESTKQDIMTFYGIAPEKIEVIYQTCKPVFYENSLTKTQTNAVLQKYGISTPYILYVGSIIERKNLLNLAKAMSLLPKNHHDTPLYLVGGGKGAYFDSVKAFITENNLTQRVVFLQNVNDTELAILYQNTAAFVYPSVYEGFGIPIIEALFSGAPVITSTQLALTEAAGNDALCIDVSRPAAIADALKTVLDNKAFAEKMRTNGLLHAQNFLPHKLNAQMMNFYKKL